MESGLGRKEVATEEIKVINCQHLGLDCKLGVSLAYGKALLWGNRKLSSQIDIQERVRVG
jgi:hypothetical protein